MGNAYISGTGYYLPEKVVDNSEFEGKILSPYWYDAKVVMEDGKPKKVKCSSEWIEKRMGALERRYSADDEYVHDMGAKASMMALDNAGITAKDLDGIIVATATSKHNFPSTAVLIQEILGADNLKDIPIDISSACAGYNKALIDASRIVKNEPGLNYLVIASETLSKLLREGDLNNPLFGDGAGAAIVSYTDEDKGILAYSMDSDPFGGKSMLINHDSEQKMNMPEGNKVFREAVTKMPNLAKDVIEQLNWDIDDIYLIPHQANIRIINKIKKICSCSDDQVYVGIEKYANMSGATCAIGLAEGRESGKIKEDTKVILTAIGSGLVTAAVGIQF